MRSIAWIAVIAVLSACKEPKSEAAHPAQAPDAAIASASATATPSATPTPTATARKVETENDLFAFSYAYPAEAAAIPDLAGELEADLVKHRNELSAEAREGRALARDEGFRFNPYGYSAEWRVVTQIPGWLSLSALRSSYTGGAHPNYWHDALLWDREANRRRDPLDLFASKAAFTAAIREPFCSALNRERAKRRGGPVRPDSDEPFSDCIDPADSTVILGSSNRQRFDRIGILIAPYEAGAYAEGGYEVTLPVTAAVLAAVRPEYRNSLAIGR